MILDEGAQTHHILRRLSQWADECHLICGNHERFAVDFVQRYPQFGNYLDFRFLCSVDDLGYKYTELKDVLKIEGTNFIHGDIRMYGQPGSIVEKVARTFGRNTFVGHVHYPCIRFGCYTVGLSGEIDQEYNESNATRWMHGLGLCNHYNGKSWPTTIAIIDNRCLINNKSYTPRSVKSWKLSKYKAKLVYDLEGV